MYAKNLSTTLAAWRHTRMALQEFSNYASCMKGNLSNRILSIIPTSCLIVNLLLSVSPVYIHSTQPWLLRLTGGRKPALASVQIFGRRRRVLTVRRCSRVLSQHQWGLPRPHTVSTLSGSSRPLPTLRPVIIPSHLSGFVNSLSELLSLIRVIIYANIIYLQPPYRGRRTSVAVPAWGLHQIVCLPRFSMHVRVCLPLHFC